MANLVIQSPQGRDVTTSLIVAQVFGKRNADVLRDIRNLHCSPEFKERNFALMVKINELPQGGAQKSEYYQMTKDGFSFLVMGYTGDKAGQFKKGVKAILKEIALTHSGCQKIFYKKFGSLK